MSWLWSLLANESPHGQPDAEVAADVPITEDEMSAFAQAMSERPHRDMGAEFTHAETDCACWAVSAYHAREKRDRELRTLPSRDWDAWLKMTGRMNSAQRDKEHKP